MSRAMDHGWEWYLELMIRYGAFRDSKSRRKLAKLGLESCDAMNMLPPQYVWDRDFASIVAEKITLLTNYSHIVLAGRRVAAAFASDAPRLPFGTAWELWHDKLATVIPHPSGLSRTWNSPVVVEAIACDVMDFLESSA